MIAAAVPIIVFLSLCRGEAEVAWRDRVLALGGGIVAAALILAAAPHVRALIPLAPRQSPILTAFVYAAVPEETVKLAALLLVGRLTWDRPPQHWLPAATGIACGFAAAETVFILWAATDPWGALPGRLLVALPAHLGIAAVAAAMLARSGSVLSVGAVASVLVAAIVLHGAADAAFFARQQWLGYAVVASLAAFAGRAWWRRLRPAPAEARR